MHARETARLIFLAAEHVHASSQNVDLACSCSGSERSTPPDVFQHFGGGTGWSQYPRAQRLALRSTNSELRPEVEQTLADFSFIFPMSRQQNHIQKPIKLDGVLCPVLETCGDYVLQF
jgi:hypothetical protein